MSKKLPSERFFYIRLDLAIIALFGIILLIGVSNWFDRYLYQCLTLLVYSGVAVLWLLYRIKRQLNQLKCIKDANAEGIDGKEVEK
ncbi:hypothetical protein PsalN5692_00219 [Piscirickettsia salmonis]|uniref:hypothetical protein n=1 Tax=Piscirickettsia salmonis TaxID=1238 RepID=UPI0012B87CA5|nr:hypothetical protein [Piscirickettsia salmonis]QGP48814.1 hypothetical protein PsalN5692_00219 [Piscirickettsia salmonis]QGP56451.1 hypothetical protein PsalSR1_03935 [Piscirickettsia salmonis]QGP57689.1 hypothetical protein PsalBI1_00227 [Piscirickettsia salmonis]QGP66016.1 hypothetical protein PsalMR5_03936 [Piscirickettsia salmonis]